MFRSRLEAKWAVFFDSLGLFWSYESILFKNNGLEYLADFYVTNLFCNNHTAIEIKPLEPNKEYLEYVSKTTRTMREAIDDPPIFVFVGSPSFDQPNGYIIDPNAHTFIRKGFSLDKCDDCGFFYHGYACECQIPKLMIPPNKAVDWVSAAEVATYTRFDLA